MRDELHEACRLLGPGDRFSRFNGLIDIQPAAIEQIVGAFDIEAFPTADALAAHPNGIDATDNIDDEADGEGRYIFAPGCAAPDHAHFSNAQKLVKNSTPTEDDIIPDRDIARQEAVIGHDSAITNRDIVSEMHAAHQEVAIPNTGDRAFGGASMDRHILAESIVITDHHLTVDLASMVKILRRRANDGSIADKISGSEGDAVRENGMSLNGAVVAKSDSLVDNGIGANFDILSKDGLGADKCCGMNIQKRFTQSVRRMLGSVSSERVVFRGQIVKSRESLSPADS